MQPDKKRDKLYEKMRDSPLREYLGTKRFKKFKKLTILEMSNRGLLLYEESRVFIPTAVRKEMFEILHKYHFAPAGMMATAKAYIYWPNMKEDIERRYKQYRI